MSSRQLLQVFDKYQKARREFVQTVAEQASRSENITNLMDCGVLSLLRPLLLDKVPAIQQTAALAIGRLANYSEQIAEQIVESGILPEIVNGLSTNENYYKRNACFVIRTISKHSTSLAQKCVDAGALDPLVKCLESFDNKVRESAAWALGFIATHSPDLAQSVVDANAVQFLITAVQDPELSLRRISVATLGDIAKHNAELAQSVIDSRAIPNIAPLLGVADPKLKQQVCTTLAHIAKHSVDSAELVVEGEIFPNALRCLKDKDKNVRKAAATLIREIVKHTQELAQLVINIGGAAALVQYLKPEMGNDPLHAIMSIGYIASFSQTLATALINEGAPAAVLNVFVSSKLDYVKAAAAWTLGQLGKHSPEHASTLTSLNALSLLLDAHNDKNASEDLKLKTKRALKFIIEKTTEIEALQPLITTAPENILKYALEQISKLLPKNPKARVPFVTSGGFQAVQKIQAEPGSKLRDYIDAINNCYPEQAVRYYSPQYPQALIKEIESYEN
ncbi:Sperm-associated antigen 6 [Histomonas meleagridis]|uniref:Sperm-associated antigen 6 n=1 Tax=Histomonas meleagridis TaxID=135588 RepID=UPI0035597140|nr:Sperm-associated antigen 6 [Histomonas meleagridis]KAH0796738.1 Sperm-associated antigen 6 [Histomonas meleagridis]